MAVAVIGGLAVSTILSLIVVPAIHILVADLGSRIRKIARLQLGAGPAAIAKTIDTQRKRGRFRAHLEGMDAFKAAAEASEQDAEVTETKTRTPDRCQVSLCEASLTVR